MSKFWKQDRLVQKSHILKKSNLFLSTEKKKIKPTMNAADWS